MKRKKAIQDYLNECLDLSAYDVQNSWTGFINIFDREYGFVIERVGTRNALIEYLQGLPQTLNIVYTYYDITNLCFDRFNYKATLLTCYDDMSSSKLVKASAESCNNFYWHALAVNIFELAEAEKNDLIKQLSIKELCNN